MTTIEKKIIADFMGILYSYIDDTFYINAKNKEEFGRWVKCEDLKFNSDWNWLMEVVEKIETLESIGIDFYKGCIDVYNEETNLIRINRKGLTKIEAVYNACLEFINWYNEQNK